MLYPKYIQIMNTYLKLSPFYKTIIAVSLPFKEVSLDGLSVKPSVNILVLGIWKWWGCGRVKICLTRFHVLSRFPCELHWSTCRSLEPGAVGTGGGLGPPCPPAARAGVGARAAAPTGIPVRALRCPAGWKGKLQAQPAPASADLPQTQARPGNETLNKRVLATKRPCSWALSAAARTRSRASLERRRRSWAPPSSSKQQKPGPPRQECVTQLYGQIHSVCAVQREVKTGTCKKSSVRNVNGFGPKDDYFRIRHTQCLKHLNTCIYLYLHTDLVLFHLCWFLNQHPTR